MKTISTIGMSTLALSLALGCTGGLGGGDDDQDSEDTPDEVDPWDKALEDRVVDYNAALRVASLRLTGDLPTLTEIQAIASAGDPAPVYAAQIDAYMTDPRFASQMFALWQDTFKMGATPALDSAAAFAAQTVVDGLPYTDLLTSAAGNCPTFDADTGTFTAGECANGVPVQAGLLTHPGVNAQFVSNLAFRRVRWVQETFACTAFPAEVGAPQDLPNGAAYTAPWPFASIAGADNGGTIDFHDSSSVVCANCHATMNHIAPLFANFDDDGNFTGGIAVRLPTEGTPLAALTDWLPPGEPTAWRIGEEVSDLPALGAAMAADPAIAECAVARIRNWALGRGDIVDALATVPPEVIAAEVAAFQSGGQVTRDLIRSVFTSDDFIRF